MINIEEIVNEHTREIIKNIFKKLDDKEIYVILELNNQLQDKINRIDKAIDMLDLIIPELWNISNAMTYKIKEVKRSLGDKE